MLKSALRPAQALLRPRAPGMRTFTTQTQVNQHHEPKKGDAKSDPTDPSSHGNADAKSTRLNTSTPTSAPPRSEQAQQADAAGKENNERAPRDDDWASTGLSPAELLRVPRIWPYLWYVSPLFSHTDAIVTGESQVKTSRSSGMEFWGRRPASVDS